MRSRRLGDAPTTSLSDTPRPAGPSPATACGALRPELVRARDVRVIGLELGVEPARRPAAELRHALPDRLRAVLSLASAGGPCPPPPPPPFQRDEHPLPHPAGS